MQPVRKTQPVTPPEAEDLAARARGGDRDAFERLAVRAMPMLAGTARRLLREPYAAEEAVAEALFRAFRRIDRFRGDAAFGTWVHRILCRVAVDRMRTEVRERARRLELATRARRGSLHGARPAPTALDAAALDEESRRLRQAVEALPTRQRLVIVLHVWEGLSLAETAEVLGVRYATAKSNLCHARHGLRRLIDVASADVSDEASAEDQGGDRA